MRNGDSGFLQPMRIELATSEMEGGEYLAWADPEQVVACIVRPQPLDTFSRFIEPALTGPPIASDEQIPQVPDRLPPRLRDLLDRLRRIHSNLVHENRSVLDLPYRARLTLAMVEDNRVFFVKGTACWIYLIRDGVATLAGARDETCQEGWSSPALGGAERLNLALSSIEVQPGDIVVLLVAGSGDCPDRRAVAQVFAQTRDLKRACDGLVNLLGMQSSGAGVTAMRFVPVRAARGHQLSETGLFEDLARELTQELSPGSESADSVAAKAAEPFGAVSASEVPLPAFLEEAGVIDRRTPGEQETTFSKTEFPPAFRFPWESEGGHVGRTDRQAASGESDGRPERPATVSSRLPRQAEEEVSQSSEHRNVIPPRKTGAVPEEFPAARRSNRFRLWTVLLGTVVFLLIAVAAIPRIGLLRGGGQEGPTGSLRVDPDPPARAIFLDGVDMQTGSPALLEEVRAGKHRVRLDLGAFGKIDSEITIRGGAIVDLKPVATGSVEIAAAVARPGAIAWLKGLEPRDIPCRFEGLPVGCVDVFYEDEQVPLWQREVILRAGQTYRLRVNNAVASDRSLLRVESWIYRQGEGMVESPGDSLVLDGRFVGLTPWEKEVNPGLHGVRVSCDNDQLWTEVVELVAGGTRIVAPRFGMEHWPRLSHIEPRRILMHGPVLLSVTINGTEGSQARNPRLHLPGLDAAVNDMPLSTIDPVEGVYVGVVDQASVPLGRPIDYYFTVETSSGQTLCSELYRFTAVSDISQHPTL